MFLIFFIAVIKKINLIKSHLGEEGFVSRYYGREGMISGVWGGWSYCVHNQETERWMLVAYWLPVQDFQSMGGCYPYADWVFPPELTPSQTSRGQVNNKNQSHRVLGWLNLYALISATVQWKDDHCVFCHPGSSGSNGILDVKGLVSCERLICLLEFREHWSSRKVVSVSTQFKSLFVHSFIFLCLTGLPASSLSFP